MNASHTAEIQLPLGVVLRSEDRGMHRLRETVARRQEGGER